MCITLLHQSLANIGDVAQHSHCTMLVGTMCIYAVCQFEEPWLEMWSATSSGSKNPAKKKAPAKKGTKRAAASEGSDSDNDSQTPANKPPTSS